MKLTHEQLDHWNKGGKFLFWDDDKDGAIIDSLYSYIPSSLGPFVRGGYRWENIEIYNPKQNVKSIRDMLKVLYKGGWKLDSDGFFRKDDKLSFNSCMWEYCGKEKPDGWKWEPEWLEDAE